MLEQIWEVSLIFFYSSLMNECPKMNLTVFFTFKGQFPPRIVCVWDCKIVFCARWLVSVAYFTSTQSAFILTRIVFVFLCVHRNICDFVVVLYVCWFVCVFLSLRDNYSSSWYCYCFCVFIIFMWVCLFSLESVWQLLYLCLWFFCVFIKICLCFVSPEDNPPSSYCYL